MKHVVLLFVLSLPMPLGIADERCVAKNHALNCVEHRSRIQAEDCLTAAIHQLIRFLSYLNHGDNQLAYSLVALSSIKNGDPVAYNANLDWESFKKELASVSRSKFGDYHLGKLRWESLNRLRVFVHFAGGDNDETVLVCENGQWFVADPIHIIR